MQKILLIFFTVAVAACAQKQNDVQQQSKPVDTKALFTKVPGEELFKAGCITCHSLRYIEMQPPFPRKTWEKIVDKMIKNFGAPIPDSSAKVIVDYLVTIKGKS
jgi:hypothetical protein